MVMLYHALADSDTSASTKPDSEELLPGGGKTQGEKEGGGDGEGGGNGQWEDMWTDRGNEPEEEDTEHFEGEGVSGARKGNCVAERGTTDQQRIREQRT